MLCYVGVNSSFKLNVIRLIIIAVVVPYFIYKIPFQSFSILLNLKSLNNWKELFMLHAYLTTVDTVSKGYVSWEYYPNHFSCIWKMKLGQLIYCWKQLLCICFWISPRFQRRNRMFFYVLFLYREAICYLCEQYALIWSILSYLSSCTLWSVTGTFPNSCLLPMSSMDLTTFVSNHRPHKKSSR